MATQWFYWWPRLACWCSYHESCKLPWPCYSFIYITSVALYIILWLLNGFTGGPDWPADALIIEAVSNHDPVIVWDILFTLCTLLSPWLSVTNCVQSCGPNYFTGSFWNFAGVFVKVWRCTWHLAVIPRLDFVTFMQFKISHFSAQLLPNHIDTGCLVYSTPPTILTRSFCNFAGVFVKVWRCACPSAVILRLIFVIFFAVWS